MHRYKITAEIKEDKSWVELESTVKKMKANFMTISENNKLEDIVVIGHQIHNTNMELMLPDIKAKKEKKTFFKKKEVIQNTELFFNYRLDVFIKSKNELNVKWVYSLIKEKEGDDRLLPLLKFEKLN